jgi:SnoaL-like domain
MTLPVRAALQPETIVSRWVDAFNARDLDGMLDCLAVGVDFHPLRLGGLNASYRGHDGVRDWFAQLRRQHQEHRIVISEARCVGSDQVLAVGSLSLAGMPDIGPFCGLHRFADRLIVTVHHYLTDPEMIEQLGLIP